MPIVRISVTGNPVTEEQKLELIKESADMLQRVLDKPLDKTWVVIDEVPRENWGIGHQSAAEVL